MGFLWQRKRVAVAVLAAMLGGQGIPSATAGTTDEQKIARSDAKMDALAAGKPGCAAAINRGGEITWSGAAGLAKLNPREPITDDTIFDIASNSKQFTATAILLLKQRSELRLSDPVSKFVTLPRWARNVTVKHLIHHQSGIPDYTNLLSEDYDERTTVADALRAIRGVSRLQFTPGSRFRYTNSGYFLMSLIVKDVTGRSLAAFLKREVFTPLGLNAVMNPIPRGEGHATSYEPTRNGFRVSTSKWEQTGDGAVQTTPIELARWATEYWSPTIGGAAMLRARSAGAVAAGGGDRYGAGMVVSGSGDSIVFSHEGGWIGFVSYLVVSPADEVASAVVCNHSDHDAAKLGEALFDIWSA